MKIGTRLMAGFSAALVLMLAIGAGAILGMSRLRSAMAEVVNVAAQRTLLANRIVTETANMVGQERGIVLRSVLQQTAEVEKHKQEFQQSASRVEAALGQLQPLVEGGAQQSVNTLKAKLRALTSAHGEMMDALNRQQFDLVQKTSEEKVMPRALDISAGAERFLAEESRNMTESARSAEATAAAAQWVVVVLIGLGFAVGLVLLGTVRNINRVLRQFTVEMAERAEQVASSAAQVSSASQALAQAASEQAASLEETAASSHQLAAVTRKNLESSESAARYVEQADGQVSGANRTLEDMVGSMQQIIGSSGKISKIIKVIDEIAFQTNILALNAAVEAARAGAAGMGFAVVADAVSNLAQRCAAAARDTAGLIEESIATSNSGKAKLGHVVDAIRSITDSSGKLKLLVSEVDQGSREQSRSIEQISAAITQMDRVTQNTAANAEESASASTEMSTQAEAMKAIVERLQAMVGAGDVEEEYRRPRTKMNGLAQTARRAAAALTGARAAR